MKAYKTVPKTVGESQLIKMTCDKCGKHEDTENGIRWSDITTVRARFGFGSKYDTEEWEIDLCDGCITELFHGYNVEKKDFMDIM